MKTPDLNLPEGIRACFHESPAQTAGALANDVAEFLRKRLEQAPEVTLVVSGGSTPTPFFHALRDEVLDWQRVNVLLADERWVPETDPASNTRLVREQLLQGRATEARLVPLIRHGVPRNRRFPASTGHWQSCQCRWMWWCWEWVMMVILPHCSRMPPSYRRPWTQQLPSGR